MKETFLVLNAGSSSIKFTIYDYRHAELTMRYDGQIDGIGLAPHFVAKDQQGTMVHEASWLTPPADTAHLDALRHFRVWLDTLPEGRHVTGVGHRVVHGGPRYSAPVIVTDEVLQDLERYIPLAPLHQPYNIMGIRGAAAYLPGVPQVACFDTAFHRSHRMVADLFALPAALYEEGVRRYGFHGLSYEYIARSLPAVAPQLAHGRVIVAHLGNGASLCAIHDGRSVDSTMGFTGLDGLPMGTRCGQIDPGVLLYLLTMKQLSAAQIEDLLYRRSGLLGISGVSSDMRALLASDNSRAVQAIEYFVYRIGRELGALTAVLGGLDGLVFTAGIGEHASAIRARVCQDAAWLGIELDEAANKRHGPCISTPGSRVSAWVIPTDEELMIALHTVAALGGRPEEADGHQRSQRMESHRTTKEARHHGSAARVAAAEQEGAGAGNRE